jgi:hypothetical protein
VGDKVRLLGWLSSKVMGSIIMKKIHKLKQTPKVGQVLRRNKRKQIVECHYKILGTIKDSWKQFQHHGRLRHELFSNKWQCKFIYA